MRSTDAQKRDATRVLSVRRVMFAALVACALVFGGALLPAVPGSSAVPNATGASAVAGASANSAASDDPGTSDDSEVFAGKAFADPVQSSSEDNSKEVRIGYYYGDEAFQDGFGDDERKSGHAYEYYQRLAPYAGWDYTYRYLTRSEAIEALRNGEVDIVAGINKTPQLEKEFLFSVSYTHLEAGEKPAFLCF